MATLTLAGISILEPDIWSLFKLPDPIDNQLAISIILNYCGGNEVRYPEPEYLSFYIGVWCNQHSDQFLKMYNTTTVEYNPIHNYNMNDTITETHSGTDTDTKTGSRTYTDRHDMTMTREIGETETPTGQKTTIKESSKTSGEAVTEVEHLVSAYNSSTYGRHTKDITTQSNYPTLQDKETESYNGYSKTRKPTTGKDIDNYNGEIEEKYGNIQNSLQHGHTITTKEEKSGNIGVTTTQKMLTDERELLNFNFYNWISQIFENDFTICVY